MIVSRILAAAAVAVFLVAGTADAFLHAGSADVGMADMTSGGTPDAILKISDLSAIPDYAFDGSDLEVPFTLTGSGATVWLIVYTSGQNPPLTITGDGPGPYADAERTSAGWHVYDGVDYLVYKSDGERFEEGANTIKWNGKDNAGNNVGAGSYSLTLAAFDDEATPHVVGPVRRTTGSFVQVTLDTDESRMYDQVHVVNMANDWIEHDWTTFAGGAGLDEWDQTTVAGACGDKCGSRFNSFNPLRDDNYIGNVRGGGGHIAKFSVDWAARQVIIDEDWGSDAGGENGLVFTEMPGRDYGSALNADKTQIITSGGVSGTQSSLKGWSVDTGEKLWEWDVSEIFLYDNNGSDRSSGPGWMGRQYNGEPDPFGVVSSSHHASVAVRHDYDGNVKWINRNGDGYGDMIPWSAEGGFGELTYGHTEAPSFKYSIYATDWGWVGLPDNGLDNSSFGYVLGEDGSGLFKFEPKNAPLTWAQFAIIVNGDTDWDGVFLSLGGIQDEAGSNDWLNEEIQGDWIPQLVFFPLAHFPYDHARVSLGEAATAVAEVESTVLPDSYTLGNAYPNPFNPETTIRFSLPWEVDVRVDVFNEQGQFVQSLVDQRLNAGEFEVTWDGTDASGSQVSSGVYLYKITAPNLSLSKKVTLLK